MKKCFLSVFLFVVFLSHAQNNFWSNNGLVSVKSGAYISVIGDCYNQQRGIYDNSDSIFLTGNWTHDANNRCFDSINTGWVYLYAADQRIKGTSETHFYNLILKNQGTKFGDLDVYVDGNLELTDREFSLDTNTVWVLNPQLTSIKRASGFVSSLKDGGLLRRTNQTQAYLFPVGSNAGTPRYRPIEFIPVAANVNHYKARFANTDATTEGFDRSIKYNRVCVVNPNWYHRLFHAYGNDSADITIMYDELADNTWNDIVHWQNIPEWETINRDANVPGVPFNRMSKFRWNNYVYSPFALAITSPLTFTGDSSNVTCFQASNGFILLTVNNADTTYTFNWSNADTTEDIYNLGPGSYTVTLTEANRCVSTATYIITEPTQLTSSVIGTEDSCYRSTNGTATLTVAGGTPQYSFAWSNGDTTQNIANLGGGTYTVLISDSFHCTRLDSVFIYEPPPIPYAVAGVDTMIWRTDTIQLNGFQAPYYNWYPNHNLSCNDCSTPLAWPDSNIVYHLTMMDDRGCHYYDSVRIFVRDKPFTLFFIPNAITPNGDGYNDYWNIRDLERYPDNEVRIINRWGDEIFFAAPYQNNWRGTWKEEDLPGATYYYLIKIRYNGEDVKFNGPLTVIR